MAETPNNHKWRVSLYLGKETYTKIKELADFLSLPMATACRVILETGMEVSKYLERGQNGSQLTEK